MCAGYMYIDLILFWKAFSLYSCTSEPYNKICFDIIHIHCNKQLFFILSLSIDITEEGSDVGDDSDDEDFEPSLNFTLRFVILISYVSVVTYILENLSYGWSYVIGALLYPPLHCFTSVRPFVPRYS
jgi:hypothetical protein